MDSTSQQPDETQLIPLGDETGDHTPSGPRHHPAHAERRRNRKVLLAAVLLVLVPVLAIGGYLAWLNHIVTSNIREDLLKPSTNTQPTDKAGRVVPQPDANGTNYLLIGNDSAPGREGSRSDVMVLVHVPQDRSTVQLIHFPRDLWVPIPGHGQAKLNAAYAYGGSPLLVSTMQNMLGVTVDHVAMVGFEGFKRMTDAVGGVDVNVEEASTSAGYRFDKGVMHMDGDMALAFVRERKQLSEGDISRGRRQQAFIKALMLKSLSKDTLTDPIRLKDFIDAATGNLTVDQDLDVGTIRSEAVAMRNLRGSDITFVTAPFTGFGTSPDGQSIDVVDDAKMTALGEALRTDSMASYR
ncbi:MAG TPA: LCP family protein [Intrasporangium sp.]|uniref:LCP family protein n=1 Tax=Intrasporangium sp. TaxID=1925024 RepID=UPI002D767DAC|nr:LCP family protein [Intrasporangium sp.]HET7399829.1 LCP family protein [Intrasporangium sp.]